MKIFKTILKSLAILLVGAAALTSCKKEVDIYSEAYLVLNDSAVKRSVKAEYDITDFASYTISGVYEDAYVLEGEEKPSYTLGSWESYEKMLNAYIPIPNTGNWTFTLEASKSGTKFADSVAVYISSGSNTIAFELVPVAYGKEGKGSVKVGVLIEDLPFDVSVSYNYDTYEYEYDIYVDYEVVTTCAANSSLAKTVPLALNPVYDSWGDEIPYADRFGTTEGTFSSTGNFTATLEADEIPAEDYFVVFHLNSGSLKDIKKQTVFVTVTDGKTAESEAEIGYDYDDPTDGIAAIINACEYKITYELNDGVLDSEYSIVNSYSSLDESTITLPTAEDISRRGYIFRGWYTSADFNDDTRVTEITGNGANGGDKTLYAEWIPITYTISYTWGDGTCEDYARPSYTIEDTVELPKPDANQSGYEFKGWFTSEDFDPETRIRDFKPGDYTEDFELYAKYDEVSYKINYNENGGTMPAVYVDEFYSSSETITLPTPTLTGYDFGGWYTSEYLYSYTQKSEITSGSSADVTVYAKWTPTQYTITYHNYNGPNTTETGSYTIESATVTLPTDRTATGYTFAGWYTSSSCYYGDACSEIPAGSTGNREFWAGWTIDYYQINLYDYQGPNTSLYNGSYCVENLPLALPASLSTDGYSFDGWYTSNSFYSDEYVTTIPIGSTGTKSYYAKWTPVTYYITYHDYYGSDYDEYDTYTIESSDITLPTPTLSGYDFCGWYTTSTLDDDSVITQISSGSFGDVEVYANWAAQSYSITYNANDGTMPSTYTTAFSGVVDVALPTPTRTDYDFGGWYTTSTFEVGTEISEIAAGTENDVEVWALWTAVLPPAEWVKTSTNGSYYFTQSGNTWTSSGYSTTTHSISASSTWQITLVQSATISIPWSVSSEQNYDKLTITLDGTKEVDGASGSNNGTITKTLAAGTHTLVATYTKDSSQSSGLDRGILELNPVDYN